MYNITNKLRINHTLELGLWSRRYEIHILGLDYDVRDNGQIEDEK